MITSNQPHNVVLDITPSMATRWLEGNTHNRAIRQAHVNRLARDMKAGRWRLTHQGVAFSPSHVLLDGQHRLWAVIESNVTVPMRVFFNEPADGVECIDGGVVRGAVDRMTLSGRFEGSVTKDQLATLRCMVRGLGPLRRMAYSEECDLLIKHLEVVNHALHALPRGPGHAGSLRQ